ncbi:MAG: DNA mismatch endonuclease Vsr [Candidatus Electrothrix sp. ATG2]|nr:DNA mismatch endonuclease Vsr [Candidatus Electrothrix sp. ATG2]
MDVHSPEQRSYNMSRIKGKNTKPELLVRKWLWSQGYRYRLHRKDLPGKPDIVFPGQKKAIFVHGCFWHKHDCKYFKWPRTNEEFWRKKINGNVSRDQKNYRALQEDGWDYFVLWECELKTSKVLTLERVQAFIKS